VQREFNRRMKKRFDELGIEIAAPLQTVILRREGGKLQEVAVAESEAETMAAQESDSVAPLPVKTEPGRAEPGKAAKKLDGDSDDSPTSVRHSPPPSALGHTE